MKIKPLMQVLCSAITKHGIFVRKTVLVEDKSLCIPFTLYAPESDEIIPFDLIDRIILMGDMNKNPPDEEMSVSDFDAGMRRAQTTIDARTWDKIKRELKQRGVYLHDRH